MSDYCAASWVAEAKSCCCGVDANAGWLAGWCAVCTASSHKEQRRRMDEGYVDRYLGSGGESISGITIERRAGGVAATLWCWVHKGVEARQDKTEAAGERSGQPTAGRMLR